MCVENGVTVFAVSGVGNKNLGTGYSLFSLPSLTPSLSLSSISVIDIYCFRVALTQLRLGVLPINSNMYRYSGCPTKKERKKEKRRKKKKKEKKKKKNLIFQNQVENEDHFLLVCPLYTDLRNRFHEQKGIQLLQNMLRRKNTKGCRLL